MITEEIKRIKNLMNLNEGSIFKMNNENLKKSIIQSLLYEYSQSNIDLDLLFMNFFRDNMDSELTKKYFDTDHFTVDNISAVEYKNLVLNKEFGDYLLNIFNNPRIKTILNKIDNNGFIEITRGMKVNDEWVNKLKNGKVKRLGIFWSHSEGYSVYGEIKGFEILMYAKVDEKYIDWLQTLIQNLMYDDNEDEITLFKNTPFKLNKIEIIHKGKEYKDEIRKDIPVEYFNNQTFLA